jgi:hypothetical protein
MGRALCLSGLSSTNTSTRQAESALLAQAYVDAVLFDDSAALQELLQRDGPPQMMSAAANALGKAVAKGTSDLVGVALRCGASPDLRTSRGTTLLMIAAEAGHVDILRLLLHAGAELENTDINGWTALFFAAHHQRLAAANILIEAGARIDLIDVEGYSLLDVARLKRFSVQLPLGCSVSGAYRAWRHTIVSAYLLRRLDVPQEKRRSEYADG